MTANYSLLYYNSNLGYIDPVFDYLSAADERQLGRAPENRRDDPVGDPVKLIDGSIHGLYITAVFLVLSA